MKRFILIAVSTVLLATQLPAEKVTVYGYGLTSSAAGQNSPHPEYAAGIASGANAQALSALLNGCVLKKGRNGFVLIASGRSPRELSSKTRALSQAFYETELMVDAGRRLERAEEFSFNVDIGSKPDLESASGAGSYYTLAAGRVTDEICRRLMKNGKKKKLRALLIERRLGGREFKVRVRYKK